MSQSTATPSTVKLSDFRLQHRLRVRWAEVDLQKVVFNPHYLTYFDIAVTQYWRELALPYELTLQELEGDLFVKKASLEYNGSAHFDETLTVCLRCERVGNSSMSFKGAIFRDSKALILAEIVYVFVHAVQKVPKPIPAELKSLLTHYEAGEEITRLRLGSWKELRADALGVRQDVFVREQGVPNHMEEDELDESSDHVVLYNALNLPIATARLIAPSPGVSSPTCIIGRMAVRRDLRGTHWGSKVLTALERVARERHVKNLSLHAQMQAQGFYAKHHYVTLGEPFEEAGIVHIEMQKVL